MVRESAALLLALALVAACGRAPVPITPAEANGTSAGGMPGSRAAMPDDAVHAGLRGGGATADPNADPHGTDPHMGAATAMGAPCSGVVRLQGDLAEPQSAYLFLSLLPRGERRPLASIKLDLSDASVGTLVGEGGGAERTIPFELVPKGEPDGGFDLQVWFDVDGIVDTKEPESVIRSFPVENGATEIDVALEPSGQGG